MRRFAPHIGGSGGSSPQEIYRGDPGPRLLRTGAAQSLGGPGVVPRGYGEVTPVRAFCAQGHPEPRPLAPQPQALDQAAVPSDVGVAQVAEQAAAAADEQQQAAAAVVVVLVHLEVLVQVIDPAGHERDLDLRRTGVTLMDRVLRKDLLLNFDFERHLAP